MKNQKKSTIEGKETDETWMSEMLLQYVTSPIWKQHVENFKDLNCIFFEPSVASPLEDLIKIHLVMYIRAINFFLKNRNSKTLLTCC